MMQISVRQAAAAVGRAIQAAPVTVRDADVEMKRQADCGHSESGQAVPVSRGPGKLATVRRARQRRRLVEMSRAPGRLRPPWIGPGSTGN